MSQAPFPPLPLHEWESTKKTLHRYIQIVGKIRMELTPPQNHWWHVPLYVNTRGLGTSPIPYQYNTFEINFDFLDHQLKVTTSRGEEESFELVDGLSVSTFYHQLFDILDELNIEVQIKAVPYDITPEIPFSEDTLHKSYDDKYAARFWKILQQVDRVFRVFNQDFCGKVCPVQLYWHSFDLAVTRFSGKKAPPMPDAGPIDKEAYSHEVISFGFWPGDDNVREPSFYSYTFPAPEGLAQTQLEPAEAFWTEQNGSPLALLPYNAARSSKNTENTILQFLESAYRAGIEKAEWDVDTIHQPV